MLGIEGGGTRTTALFANPSGQIQLRLTFGPLNLQLTADSQLRAVLNRVRRACRPSPDRVAVCLAGCRSRADHARLRRQVQACWPAARLFIGNDLDSGLAAAFGPQPGILVIAGTGSVVVGRNAAGQRARAGGWGHLLGDHGSAYWLALRALQAELRRCDHRGQPSPPLQQLLQRLALNSPDQLLAWISQAGKDEVAACAPLLSRAQPALVREAAALLAADIQAVARQLALRRPAVVLAGGCAQNPALVRALRRHCPALRLLATETARGSLVLAGASAEAVQPALVPPAGSQAPAAVPVTEQRNPRTLDLDRQSVPQLIQTMLREEARVIPAIRRAAPQIAQAIQASVRALRRGGRLFYVGAGTSGRLGVLDASECPPTFSTDPGQVQGIIAGGAPALTRAVEAAEDDAGAGEAAIRNRGVRRRDVVLGIAASGRTPFVLGALAAARQRGAATFLLCFSPPPPRLVHGVICIRTGPEVLTGSTRLKAGTATKLVLNILSTATMVRLGKTVSNLMVDVRPTNAKLRARACRILASLCNCPESVARQRLEQAGWVIARAWARHRRPRRR